MIQFAGKTAVVTGAASGIGLALARQFSSLGASVVMADVDRSELEAVVGEIDGPALTVIADVTKADDMRRLCDVAYGAYGAVHILCNNAGVLSPVRPIWELSLEDWNRTISINTQGVIHGVHFFLPRMMHQGGEAWIINTASMAGLITAPYSAPYYASKHAVVALSECLHFELAAAGSAVRVLAICPGWVNTKLADLDPAGCSADPAAQKREKQIRDMVHSAGSAQEVARHVVEAVRDGQLYVFTQPERLRDAEARFEDILKQSTPTFPRR